MTFSRREFIKSVSVSTLATPLIASSCGILKNSPSDNLLDVHIFSKHLQFLDLKEAAQVAAELGFNGLDLTVRPKGHVLPENVKTDLPKAIQDIQLSGSACKMMTTAVSDASNPLDADVIQTAADQGIKFYRCNWFKYKEDLSLEDSLEHYKEKVRQLAELNKANNIIGCYQNHSGTKVGASVWEVKKILETATFTSEGHDTIRFTKNLLESEFSTPSTIPEQTVKLFFPIGRDGVERENAYAGELQYFKQGAYNQTNGKKPVDNLVWSTGADVYDGDIAKQYANGDYAEVWFKEASVGVGVSPNQE